MDRLTRAAASSSLGVLTTNFDAPVVAETTVSAHFLHALDILAELLLKLISKNLAVFAGLVVLLTIQKPLGDAKVKGVLDDSYDFLDLIGLELASALVSVNLSLL